MSSSPKVVGIVDRVEAQLSKVKHIPVKDIDLDSANPRIADLVDINGKSVHKMTQSELTDYLKENEDTAFNQFYPSIKLQGVKKAIFLQKKGKRYLVKEGNVRISILRTLITENPGNKIYQTVPAQIYGNNTKKEDIDVHITYLQGPPANWGGFQWSRNIYLLHTTGHRLDADQIALQVSIKPTRVAAYIDNYKRYMLFAKYFKTKTGKDADPDDYSKIAEMPTKLKAFTNVSKTNRQLYFDAIIKPPTGGDAKLKNAQDIRQLNKIIDTPQGVQFLKKSSTTSITMSAKLAKRNNAALAFPGLSKMTTVASGLNNVSSASDLALLTKDPAMKSDLKKLLHDVAGFVKRHKSQKPPNW